jgi:hypothetical protein
MRAGEFVSEIGDSPAEHEPNRRRRRSLFHATVDGQWVDVFFDRSDLNGTLHITFTVNRNYEAPKVPTRASGSTIKILSTVLAIIRQRLPEYMKSSRPPAVSFTAQGDKRAALYRKYFVPVIQGILGPRWELNEYPSMGMTVFNWRPAKQDRNGINEIGAPGELDVSEKLQRYLTDRGYDIAGEGRDQMVFHKPGQHHVVKVIGLGDDLARRDNVADYVRFFSLNQRNPHFPRVSQPREIQIGDEIYTIYRQELLQNLPGEEEVMDWMEKFGAALSDPGRARAWVRENPPPSNLPRQQVQGLYTAVRRLQQFYGDDLGGSIKLDLGHTGNFMQRADGTIVVVDPLAYDESYDTYSESVADIAENFADGKVKGKSRPGRVKRAGASCKGSVTDLRARAKKYGGERGRMYHWCANMKGGKKK